MAGASRQRPVELAQPLGDGARAISHPRRTIADEFAGGGRLAREDLRRVPGQPEIGRVADIGLHDGRVDPRRASDEPPLAHRAGDHRAANLLNDPGPLK